MTRRFAVLVNAAAGSVDQTSDELVQITRAFADAGINATVEGIDPHRLPESIEHAWNSGVEAVVIAGGDGSVNCAAGVAAGTDIVLGVLPMGTFNHFAKDLGMPTNDLSASVSWLARAVVRPVDIAEVNGTAFVNNASIGVYPRMVAERESIRRRRGWGKIRAAPVAIIQTLRRLPVHRLRLTLDDANPVDVSTALLFIGNGSFDDHGERLGRRTSLTDQRLGVYFIATSRRRQLIVDAIKSRVSGIESADKTQRFLVHELVVDSDDAGLAIALDGEPTELRVPLVFRSRPGALRVLADVDDA
ncbi:MAG: diacylglycerol kinase family lipid kinase [Ilumatobacteraceae bacterium]|nr:diacylglycerol kinase family lipid kinase [Ilumatobacteraceae bacterium]